MTNPSDIKGDIDYSGANGARVYGMPDLELGNLNWELSNADQARTMRDEQRSTVNAMYVLGGMPRKSK